MERGEHEPKREGIGRESAGICLMKFGEAKYGDETFGGGCTCRPELHSHSPHSQAWPTTDLALLEGAEIIDFIIDQIKNEKGEVISKEPALLVRSIYGGDFILRLSDFTRTKTHEHGEKPE